MKRHRVAAARAVTIMSCWLLGSCTSEVSISSPLPVVVVATSGEFPQRPMTLQETDVAMKSGGLRGPIIYSNPTEVEADLLRTAAGSDHEPAIGRGLGVFGSLSSSLVVFAF